MASNPVDSVIVKFELDTTGIKRQLVAIDSAIKNQFKKPYLFQVQVNQNSLNSLRAQITRATNIAKLNVGLNQTNLKSIHSQLSKATTLGALNVRLNQGSLNRARQQLQSIGAGRASVLTPGGAPSAAATAAVAASATAASTAARHFQNLGRAASKTRTDFELLASSIFTVRNVLAAVSTLGVFRLFGGMSRAAASFEQGMVGVAKTTGMAKQDLAELGKEIRLLARDLPVATTRLLEIAETAGQVGVRGTANIAKFTKVLGQLELSTNVVGAEGAASIARVLNLLEESPDTVDRFGSALVALGNDAVSTEAEILEVATKVAQATGLFDFSSAEVLGLSTAMKDLGINAEIGSTQLGISLKTINDALFEGGEALQVIIPLMGKSQEELKKAFTEDTFQFFQDFVESLSKLDKTTAPIVLNKLNLEGARMGQVFGPLAKRFDLVTKFVDLAAKAQKENTALVKEAEAAATSFTAKMQLVRNRLSEVGSVLGDNVNKAFGSFADIITGGFVKNLDSVSRALEGVGTALAVIGTSAVFITLQRTAKAAKEGSVAFKLLNISLAGSFTPATAAILAVAAAIGILFASRNNVIKVYDQFTTLSDVVTVVAKEAIPIFSEALRSVQRDMELAFGKSSQEMLNDFVVSFAKAVIDTPATADIIWTDLATSIISVVSSIDLSVKGLEALANKIKLIGALTISPFGFDSSKAQSAFDASVKEFETSIETTKTLLKDADIPFLNFEDRVRERRKTIRKALEDTGSDIKKSGNGILRAIAEIQKGRTTASRSPAEDSTGTNIDLDLLENTGKTLEPFDELDKALITLNENIQKSQARLAAMRGELEGMSPDTAEAAAGLGLIKDGAITSADALAAFVARTKELDELKKSIKTIEDMNKLFDGLDAAIKEPLFKTELLSKNLTGVGEAAVDAAIGLGLTNEVFKSMDPASLATFISLLQELQKTLEDEDIGERNKDISSQFADEVAMLNREIAINTGANDKWARALGISQEEMESLVSVTGELDAGVLNFLSTLGLTYPELLVYVDKIRELQAAAEEFVESDAFRELGEAVGDAFVSFGDDITASLLEGELSMESFKESFRNFVNDIIRQITRIAVYQKIGNLISDAISNIGAPTAADGGAGGPIGVSAKGNVFAYAKGGTPILNKVPRNRIVGKATMAPMALFGEAGPEAIMPLAKYGGNLGIKDSGTGAILPLARDGSGSLGVNTKGTKPPASPDRFLSKKRLDKYGARDLRSALRYYLGQPVGSENMLGFGLGGGEIERLFGRGRARVPAYNKLGELRYNYAGQDRFLRRLSSIGSVRDRENFLAKVRDAYADKDTGRVQDLLTIKSGVAFSGGAPMSMPVTPFAQGGVFSAPPSPVTPFASGGAFGSSGMTSSSMVQSYTVAGPSVYIDARGSNGDAAVMAAVERGLMRAAPSLINASVTKMRDDRRRDPRLGR